MKMIAQKLPPISLHMGWSSTQVIFVEIIPIVLDANGIEREKIERDSKSSDQQSLFQPQIPLTNFGVKQFLLREARDADTLAMSGFASNSKATKQFFIRWIREGENDQTTSISSGYLFQNRKQQSEDLSEPTTCSVDDGMFPLVYIPSDNPMDMNRQPCCIVAYANRNFVGTNFGGSNKYQPQYSMCHISQETLIRILPPRLATKSMQSDQLAFESRSLLAASSFSSLPFRRESMLHDLVGEEGGSNVTDEMIEELLQYHDEETIQELTLKLSAAMTSVRIGTTQNAFLVREKQEKQMRRIEQSVRLFSRTSSQKDINLMGENKDSTDLRSWPSLIVYSPNHGDGKTLLVNAIAKRLGCSSIHLIRPGALLAKYSTRADSALESQLHGILISSACRNQKACIILDQLDALLPARLSGRTSSGDSAIPIFNSIASYLRKLTDSMQRKREFPFPLKNPLYNPTDCDANSGQVFRVEFCLVGIVTCPDDGWRSSQKNDGGNAASILDCMIGDRYRMPLLKAATILSSFDAAFESEGVILEETAKLGLAAIVSSASWAKGSVFRRVAKQLKWILMNDAMKHSDESVRSEANIRDLEKALTLIIPRTTKIHHSSETETSLDANKSVPLAHFRSIGGNEKAKLSLEDALALNPEKQKILSGFGLSPPTGVLLYGPPGCGKTLLAKAVARLFESPGTSQSLARGGTFISLSISEIVSSEVGTSEKTIASSFEFAGKNAPSVIFLDEFQALFTDRNRGGGAKLTTTLLQCLDDIKMWYERDKTMSGSQMSPSSEGRRVVVIAATNTPWMIDSAFLRSGRFDRVVYVGLPSLSERKSILEVHVGKMRLGDVDETHTLNKLCEELSILTEGFSGADIAALCRAAAVRALGEGIEVEGHHFHDALKFDVSPSSDNDLVKRLRQWRT